MILKENIGANIYNLGKLTTGFSNVIPKALATKLKIGE